MEDAAALRRRRLEQIASNRKDSRRDIRRIARPTALVGDDGEPVAACGQPQHRLDEIRAERRIDPGRAHDREIVARLRDRLLAGQLGGAIDAERADRVRLQIGRAFRSIEDIVRRQMNDRDTEPRCRAGEHRRAVAVHPHGKLRLALGLVDGGIGRGRYDDIGCQRQQRRLHRGRLGQIDLRPCERDKRKAGRLSAFCKRQNDLSGAAGDRHTRQDHQVVFSITPSRSPA